MMPLRKPLVLAMLAAGLIAGDRLPEAQSTIFVPELAMLDGALCVDGAARAPAPPLLIAQATRTEVSPAVKAAAKGAAPAAASDQPLIPGLGTRSFRITTSSKAAQQYFDQGLRLAWNFNHAEAQRAFQKAQRLDPDCAMCYWGEAYVLGPNINVPMDPAANAPAAAAAAKAKALAGNATPREQALIAAIGARYSTDARLERPMLDEAYAGAMASAAAKFPDDLDIQAMYAESMMDRAPWNYWQPGGANPNPVTAQLVPTLEGVLKKDPNHVGAIHLYIHAVEASADAKRAEAYADKLAKLAPNAGHLVHMPAHIYYRLGRYKDSLATNQVAVKVDESYIKQFAPQGVYPLGYYSHNLHFVMVSAQMSGEGAIVVDAAARLSRNIPDAAAKAVPLLVPMKAGPYWAHAQFSDLPTVLALTDPGAELPYLQVAWRYARGVAFAQSGNLEAARTQVAEIERLLASTDYSAFNAWGIPAKDVGRIAAHVVRARIAQGAQDLDGAVRELKAAVEIQDTLPYMEPPYWYYPVRQSLGAVLLMKGDAQGARDAFRDSLAKTPNNAWSLYGLKTTFEKQGMTAEAREAEKYLARAWSGDRKRLDLQRL
jgi:tetratricopeptide (TPR) repeat protein